MWWLRVCLLGTGKRRKGTVMAENQYETVSLETLREWRTGAWLCNRTDVLEEIHNEILRRTGACDCVALPIKV